MKTLYLLFSLGLIATLAQPVITNKCPSSNEPPNRGDCRQ